MIMNLMARFMYSLSAIEKFENWSDENLQELAAEISTLSYALPIYEPYCSYKQEEIRKALRDWKNFNMNNLTEMKYLSATTDNHVLIKGCQTQFTPLQLISILEYSLKRLSKNSNIPGISIMNEALHYHKQKQKTNGKEKRYQ